MIGALRFAPSQQLGKVTCSRRLFRRPFGQVGIVLDGSIPERTPQLQNVTRRAWGLVAFASPAIIRNPGGKASTSASVLRR
jgi:hypothetical protein